MEEFKRIKVNLPLIELMRIPEIQETLLGSLAEVVTPKNTSQNVPNRGVFNTLENTNIVELEVSSDIFDALEQSPNVVGMTQTLSKSSNQRDMSPEEVLMDTNIFQEEFLTSERPQTPSKK